MERAMLYAAEHFVRALWCRLYDFGIPYSSLKQDWSYTSMTLSLAENQLFSAEVQGATRDPGEYSATNIQSGQARPSIYSETLDVISTNGAPGGHGRRASCSSSHRISGRLAPRLHLPVVPE